MRNASFSILCVPQAIMLYDPTISKRCLSRLMLYVYFVGGGRGGGRVVGDYTVEGGWEGGNMQRVWEIL